MNVYARTNIGKVRPINEDSYYLPQQGERFCAVADGMGGHNAGEIASAMAVRVFSEEMIKSRLPTELALRNAVEKANRAIFQAAKECPEQSGMGTTFTALCQDTGLACIAHVGDSRAYLIRNGAIVRLTTDHTLVEALVMQGLITPQEAKVHPRRNYVTRALGTMESVEVDTLSLEIQPGDMFLLCSDGLSGSVEEKELLRCALAQEAPDARLQHMIEIALERGGQDNITAILVVCEEAAE